jgi:hypothetical protein
MRLPAFIALLLGIGLEALNLWEQSRIDRGQVPSGSRAGTVAGPLLSPERQMMALVMVVGMALIAVSELTGLARYDAYMGQPHVDVIFILLGLGVVYYGLLNPLLLPRINEQTALSVHTTVLLSLILARRGQALAPVLLILGLATLVLAYLALSRRPASPMVKAGVYLWYLIALLGLTLQNDFSALTQPASNPLPLAEAFIVGASGLFLLLHSLFLVRFSLIASSLILPRNRPLIGKAIPRLFTDKQMPRWQAVVIPALIAGVFAANERLGFAPERTLANVLILLLVQGIFNAPKLRASPSEAGDYKSPRNEMDKTAT